MNRCSVCVMRRRSAANAAVLCLLLLAALSAGCGDPYSVSQIKNDTAATIEIELVLDKSQWSAGFEPEEYERWLAELTDDQIREELQKYAEGGQGVELVAVDAARFAGKYRVAPSGLMIVQASMGKGPYFHFTQLTVTKDNKTSTFADEQEIRKLFQRVEGNLWEISVTDAF